MTNCINQFILFLILIKYCRAQNMNYSFPHKLESVHVIVNDK